jgi:hypothetical protein
VVVVQKMNRAYAERRLLGEGHTARRLTAAAAIAIGVTAVALA